MTDSIKPKQQPAAEDQPTKAPPRMPPRTDSATILTTDGRHGTPSGVGKGMRRGPS